MSDKNGSFRLYNDLAWLWPYWGGLDTYGDYCEHVNHMIQTYARICVRSVLNIGCGGGKNVFFLKNHYDVTGIDISRAMLAIAKELNPECEFLQGDMRSFSLGRTFDAVLMDDAIAYMTSRADLKSAFEIAFQHLNPGGVLIVGPDDTTESFRQNQTMVTPATGDSMPENLDVVFIDNYYDPDPSDDWIEGTLIFLIREDGKLRVETDHHIIGLFPLAVWRNTLTEVGFTIHELKYEERGREYHTFACVKDGP